MKYLIRKQTLGWHICYKRCLFQLHKHEGIIITSNVGVYVRHPLIAFSYLNSIRFKHPPHHSVLQTAWHNPNSHIAEHRNKWESTTLTTYVTVEKEMPMGYTTNTCVSRIHVFMQGWLHDGKHLHVCNYNFKLQQSYALIPKSYRVAAIVEH